MRKILGICLFVAAVAGCRDQDPDDFPITAERQPYEELPTAADTAEEQFRGDEAVGVISVQGGRVLQGPFTATGNLRTDAPGVRPPGAVTITEEQGSTRVLINLDNYDRGAELQATFVRGQCGQSGEVVQVLEPVIQVPQSGIASYETMVPVPTRTLFDGTHSIKIVPPPAEPGLQDAAIVIACADLMEVQVGANATTGAR